MQEALARAGPHLLVLDGLERVQQQAETDSFGKLEDPLLRGLLQRLAEGDCPALVALVQVEPKRSAALVCQLVEALGLSDQEAILKAVEALDQLGQPAVRPLLAALKNRHGQNRAQAAFVLACIGPGARRAVPVLIELLKDKDADMRRAAAGALERIDPEAARKAGAVVPAARVALHPRLLFSHPLRGSK